jgi:hypothetical protein
MSSRDRSSKQDGIEWNDPIWDNIACVMLEEENGPSYCMNPSLERMLTANKQEPKKQSQVYFATSY